MSLLAPRLCLRALPSRPATQLCRAAARRTFATSPFLHSASPKPPKRPGFLSRIKWYKEGESAPRERGPGAPLTMYEELPPTYRDREGLAFAKNDLTPAEVLKIFGGKVKPDFANSLLRIMHGRRVAGTLEDPAYTPNTAHFTSSQRETALRYLRETIPVDETMNKGLRAQDELEQLEKQIAGMDEGGREPTAREATAETAAAQTPETGAKEPEAPREEPEPEPEVAPRGNSAYGVSALDRIRARNIARIRAEEKRIEEEQKIKGEPVAGTLEAYVDRGAMSPKMEEWQAKGSSGLEAPPPLSTFDRLAPSVTFAALVIAGLVGWAAMYEAPDDFDRVFADLTPEFATVATLIGLNLAVYACWKLPPLWRVMNNYFMLVVGMPRPITVVTAMFSHQKLGHLALNMAVLYYVGSRLHDDIGRANFLAIYLSSGVMGYVAGLMLHGISVASLGASGAVLGVTSAYFYLHAWDKFRIMGFPAPPAEGVDGFAFLLAVLAWNAVALFAPAQVAGADAISHIGGLVTGMGMVHLLRDGLETIERVKKSIAVHMESGAAETEASGEKPAQEGEKEERKGSLDLWGTKHV